MNTIPLPEVTEISVNEFLIYCYFYNKGINVEEQIDIQYTE